MHFIRKCISRTAKYWKILEGKTTSRRHRMTPEKRSWRESLINPTSSVDDLPWRRHVAFLARSLHINHISLTNSTTALSQSLQMYSRKKNKLPQRCLDCRCSEWPALTWIPGCMYLNRLEKVIAYLGPGLPLKNCFSSSVSCIGSPFSPWRPGTPAMPWRPANKTKDLKGQCHERFFLKKLYRFRHMPGKDFEWCWKFVELFILVINSLILSPPGVENKFQGSYCKLVTEKYPIVHFMIDCPGIPGLGERIVDKIHILFPAKS
jgi:hypothetical protein